MPTTGQLRWNGHIPRNKQILKMPRKETEDLNRPIWNKETKLNCNPQILLVKKKCVCQGSKNKVYKS